MRFNMEKKKKENKVTLYNIGKDEEYAVKDELMKAYTAESLDIHLGGE